MERLSPEQAVDILKREGMQVTTEQAKKILDFLYHLSNIIVAQYLRKQEKNQSADNHNC